MMGTVRRLVAPAAAVALAASMALTGTAFAGTAAPAWHGGDPAHIKVLTAALDTMTKNYATLSKSVLGPQNVFDYTVGELWKHGIDGTGTTVAVIEGWDDPNIAAVVHNFDVGFGLPDPDIQTIFPSGDGHLPAQCPPGMVALGSYGSCDAWVGELDLDVLAVHLMAPYAKILISATPADSEITDDAASQVAPPEMMQAVSYIASHHLADAMSISDGTGESTYSHGTAEITAQDPGLLTAAAAGVPVMVATGDCGVVQNLAVASSQCGATTTGPATAAWDDSPWVTAIGGSVPDFDATGNRAGPDPLWHAGKFSPGAGFSDVYSRPSYQDGVKSITGSARRAVPDITMNGSDGTSESAPLFAGVLALGAQLNHGAVGPINKILYELGPLGAKAGIADVVSGNNSFQNGTLTVPGFTAGPGFDVASGWGTVDASRFLPALLLASHVQNPFTSLQSQAQRALDRLRHNVKVTTGRGSAQVSAGGYLPGHPVRLAIDGKQVTTLTADDGGSVAYTVDSAKLGRGNHQVTLSSMLLTSSADFRTH